MGISDAVNAKMVRVEDEPAGAPVARGEAELGFQQMSELLPVAGIDIIGPLPPDVQPATFYAANGVLSSISDNVFVASVYISQVAEALAQGDITRQQFEHLTVAINTGTNIPSVATPNGQAAFLFLLTSSLAPLLRLSYGRMVVMALPYTVTMTGMGLLAVAYWL